MLTQELGTYNAVSPVALDLLAEATGQALTRNVYAK